jgi:exopolysaccharide production protein ExoQ
VTAREVTRNAGRTIGSYAGQAPAVSSTPSRAEWWFVYVVLLATAAIPALSARYDILGQTTIQVFWSIAYVIAARQLLRMRTQVLPLLRRHAALWGLIALMFLSTLWSVTPNTTIIDSIELLGTTLIGLYIATRFTLPDFLRVLAVVFATIGALSFLLVFVNPGYGRADWGSGPWQGIFEDKNISGAMASLAIISQIVLLPLVKGRARWLLVAGLLLAGLLLLEANSATAFGDCAAVVIVTSAALACRSRRFGGFARFATTLGILLAIVAIAVFGVSSDSVYAALGRSSDLTSRSDFWPYLQQAIADRPLLGYGFDAFFQSPLARDYLAAFIVQAGGWTPYHAHDSYLQTLLDGGYLALALLIVLLLISIWRAIIYFGRERSTIGLWPLAIILFLTIGSYTETYYLNFNSLEWILFVAAIVYPTWKPASPVATAGWAKKNDRLQTRGT